MRTDAARSVLADREVSPSRSQRDRFKRHDNHLKTRRQSAARDLLCSRFREISPRAGLFSLNQALDFPAPVRAGSQLCGHQHRNNQLLMNSRIVERSITSRSPSNARLAFDLSAAG